MFIKVPMYFEVIENYPPEKINRIKTYALGDLPETLIKLLKTSDHIVRLTIPGNTYGEPYEHVLLKVMMPEEILKAISSGKIKNEKI